jgi:DNA-binding response OmpR family regulator
MKINKHVLVVDDDTGVLKFVEIGLGLAGYAVTTTKDGNDVLNIIKTTKPDIVLLDIFMCPVGGFEILDQLRSFSKVPVIVFTAQNFIADRAMEMGANGFIAKPFRPEVLINKIKEVLV